MTSPLAPPLWQLLDATAHILLAVRRGQSTSMAMESVPQALRQGTQALAFQVLRNLGRANSLRQQLARGKVEVSARYEPADSSEAVTINTARVQQLLGALREIDLLAANTGPLNTVDLLHLPGVLITQEVDASALLASADALFAQAMQDFIAMRAREGAALHELVEARLQGIEREVAGVRERLPLILQHFRSKLLARVAEAKAELSADRLEQEVVLFAQKMDVAEEVDRLLAHVTEIRRVLASGGAVGRRLDFLMQELNREANTLGSKSVSADSTLSSVELKVLIEQMREQIQNLE